MIYFISDVHAERDFEGLKRYMEIAGDDDLLIILGDLMLKFDESPEVREFTEYFLSLDKNIAFIDGNHENYEYVWSHPEEEWCGGRVLRLTDKIVYLKRGEIYDIEGKSFFSFGGCKSSPKWVAAGLWYPGEEATPEEIARARENLMKRGNKVDYVLTHKYENGIDGTLSVPLLAMTQYIEANIDYKAWYYGHWHSDEAVDEKHILVYKELTPIKR